MINFHRVLISTAILFSLGFAGWAAWAYAETSEFWALGSAVGFGLASFLLAFYLKNLRRFLGR